MTSCNHAWNIYLDTTCFKLVIFIFICTYLFVYLFISILLHIVSIWLYLLLSVVILYQEYIFCAWLHEVIPNSNLYWQPTEEVTDEASLEVAHILCNYVSKANSNEAFPKSRCCSVILLSSFNKWNFVKEVHGLNAPATM